MTPSGIVLEENAEKAYYQGLGPQMVEKHFVIDEPDE